MRHIVDSSESRDQLDDRITDDKPLGLDGDQEIEVNHRIGEHHAKSQQQTVYGARSTDGVHHVQVGVHRDDVATHIHRGIVGQGGGILYVLHQLLAETCADAAHHIEQQETL